MWGMVHNHSVIPHYTFAMLRNGYEPFPASIKKNFGEMNMNKSYVPGTELRNPASLHIDEVSTEKMLGIINNEDKKVAIAIEENIPQIAKAVDAAENAIRQGGRVIYMGCGTSGRIGVLDASECPPTYNVPESWFMGIIAGGHGALVKSSESMEDSEELGVTDLKNIHFTNKDLLIGIAASGRTPYVIGGLNYANALDAKTVCVVCSSNSPMAEVSKIAIAINVGPEAITGSTRMKAGTAQKMVLNMISTGTMVRLGKVYGNLMVDLRPSNSKLIVRAQRIICEVVDCTMEQAADVLAQSGNNVKVAIIMLKEGLDRSTAEKRLEENNGVLKHVIGNSYLC